MKPNRLRFRAWDYLSDPPEMVDYVECEEFTLDFLFHDQLDPMQSTGLTDKNGVEIYEGDIYVWKQPLVENNHQIYVVHRAEVIFDIQNLFFLNNRREGSVHGVEVIGNIYQDAELLGKGVDDEPTKSN
jgi:uncharacterized phage protein (TIGR01671 family)